jgi:hypothetical protein
MWTLLPYLMKQWWDSHLFQGLPSFVFAHKLKALKLDFKNKWMRRFGNVERNKRILVEDLQDFDALEEGPWEIESRDSFHSFIHYEPISGSYG